MAKGQMKVKMKNAFEGNWWVGLIAGLIIIALGCFMLFWTDSFMSVAVIIMGILAIVTGVSTLVSLHTFSFGVYSKGATIFKGIVNIIVGFVVIILPLVSKSVTWAVLLYVLGVQLVISALISFWDAFTLRKSGFSVSGLVMEGVLSLIFALLMFLFPQAVGKVIVKVVGGIVGVSGIGVIIWAFRIRKLTRGLAAASDNMNIVGEAEILDDDKK